MAEYKTGGVADSCIRAERLLNPVLCSPAESWVRGFSQRKTGNFLHFAFRSGSCARLVFIYFFNATESEEDSFRFALKLKI